MKNFFVCCWVVAASLAMAVGLSVAAEDKEAKPKHDIKTVMGKAHKGDDALLNKVTGADATEEQKKELLELYTSLSQNEPPMGATASWKTKTGALVAAAKASVDGKANAAAQLKKAANCAACHKAHKPPA